MFRNICYTFFALGLVSPLATRAWAQPSQVKSLMGKHDFRRGLESVVRAASQSSQSQSGPTSPLIDAQTAKGMSYDNQIKSTNTFFQKRQLNRMYRAEERGPRLTQAQYSKLADTRSPSRLNANQFDSFRGGINWPVVLRESEYQAHRESLDALYAKHTSAGGGMNTREYAEIQRLSKAMASQLRGNVGNTNPEQYAYARKFLEGLAYEARYPAGA